jgi:hypothetical protein
MVEITIKMNALVFVWLIVNLLALSATRKR